MNKRMDIRTASSLQRLHISGLWYKILQSGHSEHQKCSLSLEARSPKSKCPTDTSKGSRGESFLLLPTPKGLQAFFGLWLHHSNLYFHPRMISLPCVCVQISLPL